MLLFTLKAALSISSPFFAGDAPAAILLIPDFQHNLKKAWLSILRQTIFPGTGNSLGDFAIYWRDRGYSPAAQRYPLLRSLYACQVQSTRYVSTA